MSERQHLPLPQRIPIGETQHSRDGLLVISAVGFLVFLFFILPLIRIGLGEPPT
jgi:hypothetical protein